MNMKTYTLIENDITLEYKKECFGKHEILHNFTIANMKSSANPQLHINISQTRKSIRCLFNFEGSFYPSVTSTLCIPYESRLHNMLISSCFNEPNTYFKLKDHTNPIKYIEFRCFGAKDDIIIKLTSNMISKNKAITVVNPNFTENDEIPDDSNAKKLKSLIRSLIKCSMHKQSIRNIEIEDRSV